MLIGVGARWIGRDKGLEQGQGYRLRPEAERTSTRNRYNCAMIQKKAQAFVQKNKEFPRNVIFVDVENSRRLLRGIRLWLQHGDEGSGGRANPQKQAAGASYKLNRWWWA